MRSKKYLALSLIGALMGSMITFMTMPFFTSQISTMSLTSSGVPAAVTTINANGGDVNLYKAIVTKAEPSVVGITTKVKSIESLLSGDETSGVGTGVIVDSRGYILTNSHVVMDGAAKTVRVLFHDSETLPAEILWTDKLLDLAVLKVDKENLPVAELGDSDLVEVGDIEMAIGNPLGLEFKSSATEGIVSGLDRKIYITNPDNSVSEMQGLIQTSAAINPGNSGGPLLNITGQVIGINSTKASQGEGLGFAIPINIAKPIVEQFIKGGSFNKMMMGVVVDNAKEYQELHDISLGIDKGVIILKVEKDSVAQKAGVRATDIIIKIGDKDIENRSDLLRYMYTIKKGQKIDLVVWRDEAEVRLTLQF